MATIETEIIRSQPAFTLSRRALLKSAGVANGGPVILGPAFGLGAMRDGIRFADVVDQRQWEGLLVELSNGGPVGGFGCTEDLFEWVRDNDDGSTPISLINLRYRRPGRHLSRALLRAERDDAPLDLDAEADALDGFETRTAFAASAILPRAVWGFERLADQHRGLRVRFRLAPELLVSDDAPPEMVEIDFDDGDGFRAIAWGDEQSIDYEAEGDRRLVLRATTPEGVRTAAFMVSIVAGQDDDAASPGPDPSKVASSNKVRIVANIAHEGAFHAGVAHIYWADGNTSGKLRRPILLAEGFPGGNPPGMIYDYFNGYSPEGWNGNGRLAETLRRRGYDIVILIGAKPGAEIQGCAFVYLRALQWMREQSGARVAALGGSMGGLVARYALAYAEHHDIDISWVSQLITFDSPHCGANLPLAVQFAARYFRARAPDVNAMLDYPCARQMLMHQYWGAASESPVKATYTDFYAELESLASGGFPASVRKYAVSNGARNGLQIGPPEAHAVSVKRGHGTPQYHAFLYTTASRPLATPVAFAECQINEADFGIIYKLHAPEGFYSRDGCAGGRAPHFRQTREPFTPPCSAAWFREDQPNNCFMPAYSALGVKRPGEAYGFKPDDLEPGQTPFDQWWTGAANTQHCTIDEGIKNWVLRLFPIPSLSDGVQEAAEADEVLAK